MIQVTLVPGEIVAQQRTPLSVRFTNTGRARCVDLVFDLRLPAGVVLMGGSGRVEVPAIPPGRTHTHQVVVEARRPGKFELSSTNFSYRNEFDMPVRVTDFRATLVATSAPAPAPVRQPVGRLRVWCRDGELDLRSWDMLTVLVTNDTGVALHDVTMAVRGPFLGDGRRSRVAVLKEGTTARFTFHVYAPERGRHVPVTVSTTYGHQDGAGTIRTVTQEDTVVVAVRSAEPGQPVTPAEHNQPAPPAERTILYLAANPRDMAPLRSDLEMRKVKERLRLAKPSVRYRIEPCPAVRFDDISQALVDFEPQVVHFSGHGDENGNLYIENEQGDRDSITPEGLADLFGQHRDTLRCVVVNACHSVRLAEAVAKHIEYVIGMRYEILDEAAIDFSVGFYLGLFAGWTVPRAFQRGRAHVRARAVNEGQHQTPLIFPPSAAPEW